jgi:hypothetical protein
LLACAALATVASYMIVLAFFREARCGSKALRCHQIDMRRTDRAVVGSDAE